MIQRVQSLYLLLAAALLGMMLARPLMWFAAEDAQLMLSPLAIKAVTAAGSDTIGMPSLYLPVLIGLAALLPLVTIFLYKFRMLQIRLCAAEAVLLVGCFTMELLFYFGHSVGVQRGSLMPASFVPLATLLLIWMAARAIFRDELLVRSLDRIR